MAPTPKARRCRNPPRFARRLGRGYVTYALLATCGAGLRIGHGATIVPAYGRLLKGLTWRRVGYTVLVAAGLALWTGPGSWMLDKHGWSPKLEIVGIRDFFVDRGWGWVFIFIVYLPVFFSQMLCAHASRTICAFPESLAGPCW